MLLIACGVTLVWWLVNHFDLLLNILDTILGILSPILIGLVLAFVLNLLLSPLDSPYSEEVETSSLDVAEELLVTWDPEFIRWHDRWFGAGARPLLYADTLQAADFLPPTEGRWVAMTRCGRGRA